MLFFFFLISENAAALQIGIELGLVAGVTCIRQFITKHNNQQRYDFFINNTLYNGRNN